MAMEGWSSEQILLAAPSGISFAQPSGGFTSGANAIIVMIAILYIRTLKLKEVNRPSPKSPAVPEVLYNKRKICKLSV